MFGAAVSQKCVAYMHSSLVVLARYQAMHVTKHCILLMTVMYHITLTTVVQT